MATCSIVIPFHEEFPKNMYLESFINTVNIFRNYDVTVCLPNNVDPSFFIEWSSSNGRKISVINLKEGFLGSLDAYNKMAMSVEFYKLFEQYDYILIVQLDAWVFRDELDKWLSKEVDYIGAPWFLTEGKNPLAKLLAKRAKSNIRLALIPFGGNGGFCLRKINTHIRILNNYEKKLSIRRFSQLLFFLLKNARVGLSLLGLKRLYQLITDPRNFRTKYNVYEDVMLSIVIPILNRDFRILDSFESLAFALETRQSEILAQYSQFSLPFAVHGWDKYNNENFINRVKENETLKNREFRMKD